MVCAVRIVDYQPFSKGVAMRNTDYQIISKTDSRKLTDFLSQEGQLLLPMVDLITQAQMAVDELIDVTGRATIEAVMTLSAQELSGPKSSRQKDRRYYLVWPTECDDSFIRPQAACHKAASSP